MQRRQAVTLLCGWVRANRIAGAAPMRCAVNKETIGMIFVIVLFGVFIALAVPYVYFLAARGWYWGSWKEMLLLGFFVACLVAGALVGLDSRENSGGQ